MKAVLALVIIYVGTFFLVIQGVSQNQAQAAQGGGGGQNGAAAALSNAPIDPAKAADIRSLMELVGARDLVQDGETVAVEQAREKLLASVPDNEKGQAFVNSFADNYQKKFDVEQVTEQLVSIYDKHFTDDEIKGLLQFYGSPLGQKVASEMPKINRETQAAVRMVSGKTAREALAEAKQQYPQVGQSARLWNGQGNGQAQGRQRRNNQAQGQQQTAQQQNPQ